MCKGFIGLTMTSSPRKKGFEGIVLWFIEDPLMSSSYNVAQCMLPISLPLECVSLGTKVKIGPLHGYI